jgi:hypothetical protein
MVSLPPLETRLLRQLRSACIVAVRMRAQGKSSFNMGRSRQYPQIAVIAKCDNSDSDRKTNGRNQRRCSPPKALSFQPPCVACSLIDHVVRALPSNTSALIVAQLRFICRGLKASYQIAKIVLVGHFAINPNAGGFVGIQGVPHPVCDSKPAQRCRWAALARRRPDIFPDFRTFFC